MIWKIVLTRTAEEMLLAISDRRLRDVICQRIEGLKDSPDRQGKALTGNLSGLRSLRAAGQRFRIIYLLERDKIVVLVVAVGLRRQGSKKDIYELAARLVRLGLLGKRGES
jgi:mRNA interferase RelE/StbE